MNLRLKKLFAREILIVFISGAICLLAFSIGYYLDYRAEKKQNTLEEAYRKIEDSIQFNLLEFRKNPIVDALYKEQKDFHFNYGSALGLKGSDSFNYFFWINVRNSIKDSSFNLTYASDDVASAILAHSQDSENYSTLASLYNNLNDQAQSRGQNYMNLQDPYTLKLEFELFALNNNFEKYIVPVKWKRYHELRLRQLKLYYQKEQIKYLQSDYATSFPAVSALLCLALLFGIRYLKYLFTWIFNVIQEKED